MKKTLMIVFAGVFVLPCLCEYASTEAKIEKTHDTKDIFDKNECRPDSVSMDYDSSTGTIIISSTGEKEKEIDIEIYKDGQKMYEDHDNVSKSGYLNYTMTEDENGEYDVYINVDGKESINKTITK
ncbi:MAG: hypothetical protein J6K19_04040 [Prevotella sp.]|nr:hypothetical protein [Prevotella sp.]